MKINLIPARAKGLEDRIQYLLIWLLRLLGVGAFVFALVDGTAESITAAGFGSFLLFLPELIERRYQLRLPVEFSFLIVVFIYASLILGSAQDFYQLFWWWDSLLHTTSGVLLGFAGFLVLYVMYYRGKLEASALTVSVLAFSLAITGGVVWEIFEFSFDQLLGTTMQPSLRDTMFDLIVDGLGALAVIIPGYYYLQEPKPGLIANMVHNFLEANPDIKQRLEEQMN